MAIHLQSGAFDPGSRIPVDHTGEGRDVSPALTWSGVPNGCAELALICDDPDAPTPEPWVHWVLYRLDAKLSGLAEGDAGRGVEGTNSWTTVGYRGPLPPPGHGVHHYHFKLYALDSPLAVGPGLAKNDLLSAMQGHVLGEGELVGTYER